MFEGSSKVYQNEVKHHVRLRLGIGFLFVAVLVTGACVVWFGVPSSSAPSITIQQLTISAATFARVSVVLGIVSLEWLLARLYSGCCREIMKIGRELQMHENVLAIEDRLRKEREWALSDQSNGKSVAQTDAGPLYAALSDLRKRVDDSLEVIAPPDDEILRWARKVMAATRPPRRNPPKGSKKGGKKKLPNKDGEQQQTG